MPVPHRAEQPLRLERAQADTLESLARGRDIVAFAQDLLGIQLNPAQRRWYRFLSVGPDDWSWLHKVVLHVAANQVGKTLGLAVAILWACWNKVGVPTDDARAWLEHPYTWFHLAPSQQQAYIPLRDIRLILSGNHPAQKRALALPGGLVSEVKQEQYYDGLEFWNGATVQFRTTEDKAKALQGRRASGISFDECAFEEHLKEIVNTVLMMRLVSTGGPLIMVSTPNGINDWFEVVQAVIDNAEPRVEGEDAQTWTTDEGWALVWSTVADNVGFGLAQADVDRMERDLDESTKEQQLRGAFLEPSEAFFTPAPAVLRIFVDLPSFTPPRPDHRYIAFWDPSVSADPTSVHVLDVTVQPWVGVFEKYYQKAPAVNQLLADIYTVHALYNGAGIALRLGERAPVCTTGFDSTSMGGAILRQHLARLSPQRAVNFAGSKKLDILTNLRAVIVGRLIQLPKAWLGTQREMLNYRLADAKLKQDRVMSLAGAAFLAVAGSGTQTADFRPAGRSTTIRW